MKGRQFRAVSRLAPRPKWRLFDNPVFRQICAARIARRNGRDPLDNLGQNQYKYFADPLRSTRGAAQPTSALYPPAQQRPFVHGLFDGARVFAVADGVDFGDGGAHVFGEAALGDGASGDDHRVDEEIALDVVGAD